LSDAAHKSLLKLTSKFNNRDMKGAFCAAVVLFLAVTAGVAAADLRVVTTVNVLASIAAEIGGEHVEVASVVPPLADVHSYAPTAADKLLVEQAAVYVEIGKLEPFRSQLLGGLNLSDKEIVSWDSYVAEGIYISEDKDPHIWLDVENAVKVARAIEKAFERKDPENAEYYRKNLQNFEEKAEDFKKKAASLVESLEIEGSRVVLGPSCMRYFVEMLGFEVTDVLVHAEGALPSAGELAAIEHEIEENNVRAVICPLQAREGAVGRLSEQVARDTGIPIVWATPLLLSDDESYFEMMSYNLGAVLAVLSGAPEAGSQSRGGGGGEQTATPAFDAIASLFALLTPVVKRRRRHACDRV